VAGPPTPAPKDVPLPRSYGRRTLATLSRLIEVLAPPADVFPRPATERVLGTVLSFIPFLAAPPRYGLPIALWCFEVSPAFFGMGRRRFASLDDAEACTYVSRWEHGRWPLSLVYQAFRSVVLASFYQHNEILRTLEIDWESRARELTDRRARLATMSPELGNPRNHGARRQAG
jgi:hypothetical protein